MKFFSYSALVLSTTFLFSCCKKCQDPPPAPNTKGTLNVQFKANYGGTTLVLNSPYTSGFNYRIQPETVKYLVHHIMTRKNGTETEIKDAFLVDYSQTGNSFSVEMEAGNYDGLKFAIGVDQSLNHSDPSLLPPSHAFSINSANDMFWTWSSGYIFMKLEGRADTTATGSGNFDRLFFFHAGADTLFRQLSFYSSPFTITQGSTKTIYVDLNVEKMLYGLNDTIDLKTDFSTHTADNLPLAIRFAELYKTAFSVY